MAMWRPPERVRHDSSPGQWPSASEASASRLFAPLAFGSLRLQARTWVPAMVPWRATDDGYVSPNVIDWYRRFAAGKPAALVVEATGIRDVPSGPLLRIGHERFVPGLRDLVAAVREASEGETQVFIQIIDFLSIRRRPERSRFIGQYLRVTDSHRDKLGMVDESEIRARLNAMSDAELAGVLAPREWEAMAFGYRERVTDTELEAIRALPDVLPTLFSQAAVRAQEASFDGAELHYAHAYTMASFLSAKNDRTDGFGGAREHRIRLPLDVFRTVRAAVAGDFVVGCRMLADECIQGGTGVEDAQYFARCFAEAGMDFISLSRGGKFDDASQPKVGEAAYPYTGPSGYECMPSYFSDQQGPYGRNLPAARQIRDAVRASGLSTPIVAGGGIHNFEQAERVLAQGEADVVSIARQALADPDWFVKVRSGAGGQVRLCKYTNYCEALDQRHREVTCELWDREDLGRPGTAMSSDGKRRLLAPAWDAAAATEQVAGAGQTGAE